MEWIECSSKLPEIDQSVIMFVHDDSYKYTNITIGYLEEPGYITREQQWTSFEDHFDMEDVSHWMPLPKAPIH